MNREIEVKFLNVNHDDVRKRLKELGAVCKYPMRLMRRKLFDYPDNRFLTSANSKRLRVRDEGDKIVLNYKSDNDSGYANEIETTVGSYETITQLLEAIGLHVYSSQESKREAWQLGDVEIVLDEWPWIHPYIEIEGPSEPTIQAVTEKLGFDWKDAKTGSVEAGYRAKYPGLAEDETIGVIPEVHFDRPLPEFLRERQNP